MARLNPRPSATPQTVGRSSTVDSLYRDPTPSSQRRQRVTSTARSTHQSSYLVVSPAPSVGSDKENTNPRSRNNTPKPTPSSDAHQAASRQRFPTPSSASSTNKRRRTNGYTEPEDPIDLDDENTGDTNEESGSTSEDQDENNDETNATTIDEEEDEETMYYNPQQDPTLRRKLRASIRNNHREMEDSRDELIKPGNDLLSSHLKLQDRYMGKVRQTADATLDSRVMILASDLVSKKVSNSLNENNGVGIDIDQFVSRCIFFMTNGGAPDNDTRGQQTQSHRAQTAHDDDEEDSGDGLDWAALGREACFPSNKRPPMSSFLLGPLSVQKRARQTQIRRGKSQRQATGPATRPEELTQADIKQSENSNLSNLVATIRVTLKNHISSAQDKVEEELRDIGEDLDEEDMNTACRRHRIRQTVDSEPAVSLFDFVINPKSFGQTVENLFYISFLIREGHAKVELDADGLPLLCPCEPHTIQQQRELKIEKHQAVFSIDWSTWQDLITAFDVTKSLIPDRVPEETNMSASGWYG